MMVRECIASGYQPPDIKVLTQEICVLVPQFLKLPKRLTRPKLAPDQYYKLRMIKHQFRLPNEFIPQILKMPLQRFL